MVVEFPFKSTYGSFGKSNKKIGGYMLKDKRFKIAHREALIGAFLSLSILFGGMDLPMDSVQAILKIINIYGAARMVFL